MLLTTPEDARWRRRSWWAFLLLTGSYVWYASHQDMYGSTWIGITYGTLGLAIILVLLFFGIRKRWYKSSVGRVETWTHSHIYLGLLVLVIILFHSGFQFRDKIAITALIMLGVVVVSGLFGAILYTTVPRLLNEVESNLTPDQMSEQINQLSQLMARLASGKSDAFQAIYDKLSGQERPRRLAGWRILFSIYSKNRTKADDGKTWQKYRGQVPQSEKADLDQLFVLSRQRQEVHNRFIDQQRYKNMLEAWLYMHVPFSIAMLIAIIAHVTAFFYYGQQ